MRDGAHGLILWAVNIVIGAALATWITLAGLSGAIGTASNSGAMDYYADKLMRSDAVAGTTAVSPDSQYNAQIGRILTTNLAARTFDEADKSYVVREISARTGLPEADAQKRLDDTVATLKAQAETARRYAVLFAFMTAASLLISGLAAGGSDDGWKTSGRRRGPQPFCTLALVLRGVERSNANHNDPVWICFQTGFSFMRPLSCPAPPEMLNVAAHCASVALHNSQDEPRERTSMTSLLTEIASGLAFPEGPVMLPDGAMLVVEIAKGCVTRIDAKGGKSIIATPGGGPNGAAFRAGRPTLYLQQRRIFLGQGRTAGWCPRARRKIIAAAGSSASTSIRARSRRSKSRASTMRVRQRSGSKPRSAKNERAHLARCGAVRHGALRRRSLHRQHRHLGRVPAQAGPQGGRRQGADARNHGSCSCGNAALTAPNGGRSDVRLRHVRDRGSGNRSELNPGRSRRFAFDSSQASIKAAWMACANHGGQKARDSFLRQRPRCGRDHDEPGQRGAFGGCGPRGVPAPCDQRSYPAAGKAGTGDCQPAHGTRIGDRKPLFALYCGLGKTLLTRFTGWRVGLITTEHRWPKRPGCPSRRRAGLCPMAG